MQRGNVSVTQYSMTESKISCVLGVWSVLSIYSYPIQHSRASGLEDKANPIVPPFVPCSLAYALPVVPKAARRFKFCFSSSVTSAALTP